MLFNRRTKTFQRLVYAALALVSFYGAGVELLLHRCISHSGEASACRDCRHDPQDHRDSDNHSQHHEEGECGVCQSLLAIKTVCSDAPALEMSPIILDWAPIEIHQERPTGVTVGIPSSRAPPIA